MDAEPPAEPAAEPPAVPPIGELVFLALERIESEGLPALDTLCREHPSVADELRRRIENLHLAGLYEGAGGPALEPPATIGPFHLGETLGEGGMGLVVAASEEPIGREVAVKLIRPEYLGSDHARERFEREVRATARLEHPGIIRIFTVGTAEGLPFFAMERIAGCTLSEALRAVADRDADRLEGRDLLRAVVAARRAHASASRVEPKDDDVPLFEGSWRDVCCRVVREVAEAVEVAHRAGVLHRDIKPSNVMVTPEGRVVLLDFGLARTVDEPTLTRTGTQVGSLPYTAPERIEDDAHATPRSDVYSLGVLLFELLTLRLPYNAATPTGLIDAILASSRRPLRDVLTGVDAELQLTLDTALARDPADRYATAGDLALDLTHLLGGRPIVARRRGVAARAWRWARRHPVLSIAAATAVLVLAVVPPALLRVHVASELELAEEEVRSTEALDRALVALDLLRRSAAVGGPEDSDRHGGLERSILAQASSLYERIVEESDRANLAADTPTVLRALLGHAACCARLGDDREARSSIERVLGVGSRRVPPDVRAGARLVAGALSLDAGDIDRCLSLVGDALDVSLGPADGELTARLWMLRASALTESERFDEAATAYGTAAGFARAVPREPWGVRELALHVAIEAEGRGLVFARDRDRRARILERMGEDLREARERAHGQVDFDVEYGEWLSWSASLAEDSRDVAGAVRLAAQEVQIWTELEEVYPDSSRVASRLASARSRQSRLTALEREQERSDD